MLMAWMPLGRQNSRQTAFFVVSASMGSQQASPGSTVTVKPGSAARYSFFRSAVNRSTAARTAPPSAVARTASAAVGMALSLLPPWADTSRTSAAPDAAFSSRPSTMSALARPLSISTPEWPPTRPSTRIISVSPSKASRRNGKRQDTRLPPAQPTVNTPSTSESMFSMVRPCNGDTSSTAAPSIPISSSVVSTASSRGWGISLSSSAARAMATAMPSSLPRVVPRAPTTSPSTKRSSPSVSMFLAHPGSFSHTMSRWPCIITAGAFS